MLAVCWQSEFELRQVELILVHERMNPTHIVAPCRLLLALLAVLVLTTIASAQPCTPQWDVAIGNPGPGQRVYGMTIFDDGTGGGPALFVGINTPANKVMKWNGSSWSQVGTAFSGGVYELAVYDDGNGPRLYAGGNFIANNGVTLNRIAKWDGSAWVSVGGGMTGGTPVVWAMTVHDDGSGPALVAAGLFGNAGTTPAANIAKWNGTSWAALGAGVWGNVSSMVHEILSVGPTLYVGGEFSHAGGTTVTHLVNKIAQWSGGAWSKLGTGMNFGSTVYSLAHFDDGSGLALYAGGTFTTAGEVPANRVARWNGTFWSALGTGVEGTGPFVRALRGFDDGTGSALFAAGQFSTAGGVAASHIAKWNGQGWAPLGAGIGSIWVEKLLVFDDGTGDGPDLYVGGEFNSAGGMVTSKIAIWRGCGDSRPGVPGDITGDGIVNVSDLLSVINYWGLCPQPCPPVCPSDITGDCSVNVADLLMVINNWG